jgi:hypothetical protein
MSKIDPTQLKKLDRRSTMLLQAARSQTQGADEKDISAVEDPGIDALRGSFGAVGSVIRARSARRMSMNSRTESLRARHGPSLTADDAQAHYGAHNHYPGMRRHQLYDAPMPPLPDMFRSPGSDAASVHTLRSNPGTPAATRNPTIKFGSQDLVHTYAPTGAGSNAQTAVHEFQTVRGHNRETNPEATDSTLGVGARYSNFLSLTSPSADTELGTPRSFIPGSIADESSGRDSVGYFVQSPSEEPLTAPAGSDSFHHPRTEDPYANSPATATAAVNTFEQRHGAGSIDSVGSYDGLPLHDRSDEEENSRGPRNFFGRSSRQNSPRRYPGGPGSGDESQRLWNKPGSMDSSADNDGTDSRPGTPGAIRIVRPPPGSGRF